MEFECETDPIDVVGDRNGVLSRGDIYEGRDALIQREMKPSWLFISESAMADIRTDSVLSDGLVTIETILQNIWVKDFEEAVAEFEKMIGPNADAMLMGMKIVTTTDAGQGEAYILPDDDAVPDADHVVLIEY